VPYHLSEILFHGAIFLGLLCLYLVFFVYFLFRHFFYFFRVIFIVVHYFYHVFYYIFLGFYKLEENEEGHYLFFTRHEPYNAYENYE